MERIEIQSCDWPRCEVCDMPVEDFFATKVNEILTFVAVCHNETETVEISGDLWDNVKLENVSFLKAFHKSNNGGSVL